MHFNTPPPPTLSILNINPISPALTNSPNHGSNSDYSSCDPSPSQSRDRNLNGDKTGDSEDANGSMMGLMSMASVSTIMPPRHEHSDVTIRASAERKDVTVTLDNHRKPKTVEITDKSHFKVLSFNSRSMTISTAALASLEKEAVVKCIK